MAHQLSSYIDPLLKQLNLEASYLLYVIPVATILAFGLLIYAFVLKKVKVPQDSAGGSGDQSKKGKSKGPKAKSKSKGSSPQQQQSAVVKSNGSVNGQSQPQQTKQQQLPAKPKAVVQPIKRDKVVEKAKKNKEAKEKVDLEVDSTADLDSGDWVTVTSKKAAKSQEKLSAKKEKKAEKLKEAKSVTNEGKIKVTNLMVDDEPTVATLESIWTGGEEEPLEFEDTRALKKKQPSKKSKEKVAAKKQAEAEAVVAEPQRIPEDKLTSTVIASYDSVPEQKSRKKSDSKKPEVAKTEPKKASKKSEAKAPVESKAQKSDSGSRPVAPKASASPEVAPVLPKPPSNKVEKPLAVAAPAPSSSTDITDATESDPSEGEFKVVRKRKARRE